MSNAFSNMIPGFDPMAQFNLARGLVPGTTIGTVFGRNIDVDPGPEVMVWEYGPTQPIEVWLTANTELFLSSSSVADTSVGIFISGMTDDYVNKSEPITFTSGQTQQSIGNWFRIFKMRVVSLSAPAGDIYCAEADTLTLGVPTTPALVHSLMLFDSNTSHKAVCTVPANHTLMLTRMFIGCRKAEDAIFSFKTRPFGAPGFVDESNFPVFQSSNFLTFDPPFVVNEKTDWFVSVSTLTNNTEVVANIAFIMVDDTL